MKKLLLIIIAVTIGLAALSCKNPSDDHTDNPVNPVTPVTPEQKTLIVFDNTDGICDASVYHDYRRRVEDKIADIPAGRLSAEIEWAPGASVPFYFSYTVRLHDIGGFTLNYVPKEIGKDQKSVRVDAGTKTAVTIPRLEETVSSPDELLSNNSYLLIQNNSSFSFQLHRGSGILSPDNSSASLVNSGERAQYTVNPGAASLYQLLVGADYKRFSGSITGFEAGRVYSFVFDGGISLIAEIEIKLENVAGVQSGSAPETPGAPAVTTGNGQLTLRWIAVQGAENYEVYVSAGQQPPASPTKTVAGTTTILPNLDNKTVYYIWIKAVNNSGSSDFSPRVMGIPWPNSEMPAKPGTPVIIPGINQLTVNWEESGGAESYEVYISTLQTAPSTPTITTEKTSAVITNLDNDVIYYIWVRAVNGAGKSDFSPSETGTPSIPTVAPTAPARPILTAGSRELAVSWQAVEFAASYEVWYGTSDNSAQAQKQQGDITGGVTEAVIGGLLNETTYYVWIKAKNLVGAGGFSLPANGKPSAFAVLPETPTVPEVTVGNRELGVSWQSAEGALSYEVWTGHSNNPANAQKHGADVSDTSVTLGYLANDTTYYIWVKAKNNIGASEFSPMANGMPSASTEKPAAPPDAPTVIAGSTQLTVSWQAAEGASSYEVWAGTSPNPTTAAKLGDDVTGLSYVITGLTNGTVYYVWIKAKNAVGVSDFSPMATGSLFTNAPQAPDSPSVSIGNGQITVTWAAAEGATAYEVWMGTANNSASANKNGADLTASLSAVISGLTNGTTYYIWIKAKNNIGASEFSPVASGKPLGTPGAPTLTPFNNQLQVTWTAVAGADEYEVYYGTGAPAILAKTTTGTTTTITGLTAGTTYYVRLRAKNVTGISDYGPSVSNVLKDDIPAPGLYRGAEKIGDQNLADSLTYISANAVSGDDFYIVLGADGISPTNNLNYSGKTVGITLLGYGSARRIILNANGSLFTVNSGVTLTIDENIALYGRSGNNSALVRINNGGKLIMNTGGRISGNNGGGVYVGSNGTFTMNGGTISDNTGSGGVYVDNGTFIMNGGEISSNTGSYDGGGVYVNSGTFTMNGGDITGNTVSRDGGGVYVNSGGTFTMTGGTISSNSGSGGPGVFVVGGFTMSGGKITGNTSSDDGGGVYVKGGTFTMSGRGEISGNTAKSSGGGVHVVNNGIFFMSGGEISGNTASNAGGGVYIGSNGTLSKTGGTITGYASDTVNGNAVKNNSGVVQSNRGHAAYKDSSPAKRRETTAGPEVDLDSVISGTAGGWE